MEPKLRTRPKAESQPTSNAWGMNMNLYEFVIKLRLRLEQLIVVVVLEMIKGGWGP